MLDAQQNARWALDALTGDLRSAQSITTLGAGCGTGPIPSGGGASSITFSDVSGTSVQYSLAGTNLTRTAGGTTTTIAPGVETFRLWCLDANGDLTVTAGNVRSLHIQIRTRSEQAMAGAGPQNQRATLGRTCASGTSSEAVRPRPRGRAPDAGGGLWSLHAGPDRCPTRC